MSLKDPIRYSSSVLAEPWSRKKLGTSGTTIARLLLTWSSAHLNVCCPKTVHLTLTSLTKLLPRIAGVRSTLHKCKDKLFVNIFFCLPRREFVRASARKTTREFASNAIRSIANGLVGPGTTQDNIAPTFDGILESDEILRSNSTRR